jgi:hypothetical protein
MSFSNSLSAILNDPTSVKFVSGTDRADFGAIDLAKNPQKTPQGFSWFLPNRVTEATVTFVGRVAYDVIGDKTEEYFSLPGEQWLPVVTAEEMAKAKIGFAIRLFNRDLPEDGSLPEELFEHNQALLEFFLTVQEEADERMSTGGSNGEGEEVIKPHVVSVRPFVKHPPNHPFFVIPVIGSVLFPQFKGLKSPGVLRPKGHKGRVSLNPHGTPAASSEDNDPANPRVFFGGLPDPLGRYRVLKMNETYSRYEMCVPPVFDAEGRRVPPALYRTAIPDGTIVAVRGSMKMYNICARGFVNRPYLFVFDRIQVIGEEMTSWAPDFKKRPGSSAELVPPKRSCSDPSPSNPQLPYDEDL